MSEINKTAKEILADSIEDIDAGRWVCGDLLQDKNVKDDPNHKPMGCAIGLVGINAGLAAIRQRNYGARGCYYVLSYPSDGNWTEPAIEAVKALADAAPLQVKLTAEDFEMSSNSELAAIEDNVVKYNDGDTRDEDGRNIRPTPAEARAWFTKALESLD